MNWELISEKTGKKWGIAIVGMGILLKMGAPTWQVMVLGIATILAQAWDDRKKEPVKPVDTN